MSSHPQRVQDVFLRMVDLPPEQRAEALQRECGTDVELKRQVERLLEAHDGPDSYLDRADDVDPTLDSEAIHATSQGSADGGRQRSGVWSAATAEFGNEIKPGREVGGRYVLQEILGEGGMGEVWVAKQSAPIRRKVAVKLIKRGMDSRAVLNRFEQERQALALMDHPNIARVLDGGMTETGQPYFVMELVNGLPLTKFCDEARLPPRERLELFVSVCQAVQHAHQKGIVHRDLKPANILVTMIDGRPVPKVIDFGVAKAVGGKLTDESLSTQFGAVVGTLEYMSPEQAGYSGVDVDTRADIYSLGVILYELLTGLRPVDAVRLKQAALGEMIRMIQEEEPTRPSTRLSTDASLPSAAAQRQMDPRKLMAMLRGELDWVVMKCLEKQRDRRYETVNALARDVLSYLANEPVEARPPSTAYRVRKFLTRHKLPVMAAGIVMASLVLGIIGTTWGWLEAQRQSRLAEGRRREADEQTLLAEKRLLEVEAAQQKAEQEKAIAEAVRNFLQDKLLSQADVATQADSLLDAGGRVADAKENPTIRELLDRAAVELDEEKINDNFPGQPLVQAEILRTVGASYTGIGAYRQAIPFLERALALQTSQPDTELEATLSCKSQLAIAALNAGDIKRAVPLFEETLQASRNVFGAAHRKTITALANLAGAYQEAGRLDEGLELYREAQLQRASLPGVEELEVLKGMAELGAFYNNARQHEQALGIFTAVLPQLQTALGVDHPHTLYCMNNIATCYGALGRYGEGLAMHEEACRLVHAKLGPDHPFSLRSQMNLAGAQAAVGDFAEAAKKLEAAIERATTAFGRKHPLTLSAMTGLADIHLSRGELEQAEALYQEAVAAYEETLGPNHPDAILTKSNLAAVYSRMQRPHESLDLFREVAAKRESLYGREHPWTLSALEDVGANYIALGKTEEGRALLEEVFSQASKAPELLDVVLRLTTLDFAEGKGEAALRRLEDTLRQYEQLRGADHRATMKCTSWLATARFKLGQYDEATEMFEALLPRQTAQLGPNDFDTVDTLRNLTANYEVHGRLDEALDTAREMLERSVAGQNPDFFKHLRSALGLFGKRLRMGDVDFALKLADIVLANSTPESISSSAPEFARFVAAAAAIHQQAGDEELAIDVLDRGLNVLKPIDNPVSPETLRLADMLGVACWKNQQFEKSIETYQFALDAREQILGRSDVETVRTLANLGVNYKDSGQVEKAVPLLEEAHQASSSQPSLKWIGVGLLDAYAKTGRAEPAKALAKELLQHAREESGQDDRTQGDRSAAIAMALLELKLFAEAEPAAREAVSVRQRTQPESWATFNAISMLGGALLGQHRYDEAEPLLLQGYEGMKEREAMIPKEGKPRLTEATQRLVDLYTATDQPEKARKYQEKLSETDRSEAANE